MQLISLSKALKLKNRLAGRLNKVQNDISVSNSVLAEQVGQVDIIKLINLREEIAESLISLKTKIVFANQEIQNDLIRQGELKSKLSWLATINVHDGKERHSYQNTEVVWVAVLKKKDIDEITSKLEAEIDSIQDKLDTFNYTTKLEVSDRSLELAS